jgi:phosphoribosyl 1,2-cyclic phosphate phosphodiesterase
MDVTLLGSGEVTGVPPLFGTLEAAGAERRRRRPGLLVETPESAVLFDVSPDVREQVREAGPGTLDAAFVTHFHHDHAGGIDDLALVAPLMDVDVYMTGTATDHFREERSHLTDRVDPETFEHGERVSVGDLTVVPFPVAHGRPTFDTVGFAVEHGDSTVAWAPDIRQFRPGLEGGDAYRNADILFVEGSPLFRDGLFEDVPFEDEIAGANAERTVLVHVNEYLDGPTEELRAGAAERGYELGRDFASYDP